MKTMKVHLFDPESRAELTLELPRDTRFSALAAILQEREFVDRRKAGWRFLYQEHLCGTDHTLADYVPEDAEEIRLDLFGFSQVLV